MPALAADNLTAAWDQNTTSRRRRPLRPRARRWSVASSRRCWPVPELSFALVTGGMMANFTALAAARHSVLAAHGWDHERDGLRGAPASVSSSVRSGTAPSTARCAISALAWSALEVVEADAQGAMRPAALAATLFSGADGPTIVCAQAGNVNSGAFDPFDEICDIAHDHGAWVHIDGAFGLWAAASPQHRHLLDGYERADSWATDAHKWLNVPYDCGIALTAHPADHAGAFAARAEYLVFSDGIRDPMDFTPEASRRAQRVRGLGRAPEPRTRRASPSSSTGAARVRASSRTRCARSPESRWRTTS